MSIVKEYFKYYNAMYLLYILKLFCEVYLNDFPMESSWSIILYVPGIEPLEL